MNKWWSVTELVHGIHKGRWAIFVDGWETSETFQTKQEAVQHIVNIEPDAKILLSREDAFQ